MGVFNWLDIAIIILLLTGMVVGYRQGLIRQLIGLAAMYIALVLGTQFFRPISQAVNDAFNSSANTLSNAVGFFIIFFAAMALINHFAIDAYKSTKIKLVPFVDQLTGIVLGVASMWIILSIAINVLLFSVNTQAWPGSTGIAQRIIVDGLHNSRLADVTMSTLPMVIASIKPWLPGGMPALFELQGRA